MTIGSASTKALHFSPVDRASKPFAATTILLQFKISPPTGEDGIALIASWRLLHTWQRRVEVARLTRKRRRETYIRCVAAFLLDSRSIDRGPYYRRESAAFSCTWSQTSFSCTTLLTMLTRNLTMTCIPLCLSRSRS